MSTAWIPETGEIVVRANPSCSSHEGQLGFITEEQHSDPLLWRVEWPDIEESYRADELRSYPLQLKSRATYIPTNRKGTVVGFRPCDQMFRLRVDPDDSTCGYVMSNIPVKDLKPE